MFVNWVDRICNYFYIFIIKLRLFTKVTPCAKVSSVISCPAPIQLCLFSMPFGNLHQVFTDCIPDVLLTILFKLNNDVFFKLCTLDL